MLTVPLGHELANFEPALIFAHEQTPAPRFWLWPRRLALGTFSLLVGDPGVGKSLLVADIAARVSAGRPWADPPPVDSVCDDPGYRYAPRRVGASLGVVLATPEDDVQDTLLPRLNAAGACLDRICIINGIVPVRPRYSIPYDDAPAPPSSDPAPLRLPTHLPLLAQAVRSINVPRLLILDPLHALLDAACPHALQQTCAGLAEIARAYGVTVLATGHLIKNSTMRTLYRVRGALTLIAAARTVLLLAADPDRPARRVLATLKSVYGPLPPPLAFDITDMPRLEWEPVSQYPAAPPPCQSSELYNLAPEAQSALAEAADWLTDYLAAGPRPALEVAEAARDAFISNVTLRRAKSLLGVRSTKQSSPPAWHWTLPNPPPAGDTLPAPRSAPPTASAETFDPAPDQGAQLSTGHRKYDDVL